MGLCLCGQYVTMYSCAHSGTLGRDEVARFGDYWK